MEAEKKYKSLEEMYLDSYKLIYMFIQDYTKDWYLAEEISSIIWTKIVESPEIYLKKDINYLHNYMRVMVRNEVMRQFRMTDRQNKIIEKAVAHLTPPCTIEEDYILQENLRTLAIARSQLSEEENQLLEFRFDNNFTVRETGEALGLNMSTVKMRQSRILAKLRKLMR